jgi:hypothetical protein
MKIFMTPPSYCTGFFHHRSPFRTAFFWHLKLIFSSLLTDVLDLGKCILFLCLVRILTLVVHSFQEDKIMNCFLLTHLSKSTRFSLLKHCVSVLQKDLSRRLCQIFCNKWFFMMSHKATCSTHFSVRETGARKYSVKLNMCSCLMNRMQINITT